MGTMSFGFSPGRTVIASNRSTPNGSFTNRSLCMPAGSRTIVRGVSPKPVYLWVHAGEAELRDAGPLWGI